MKSVTIFRLRHNRKYTTHVETKTNGRVRVCFEPVVYFGRVERSMFSTNDEEVIEGLKKHREYGSIFHVEEEGVDEAKTSPAAAASDAIDLRALLQDPGNAVEEPTVTSAQMANNWLQKHYGKVFEATRVRDMKIEAATKYNVIFVNW